MMAVDTIFIGAVRPTSLPTVVSRPSSPAAWLMAWQTVRLALLTTAVIAGLRQFK
ncbi:MAG: hypothetical protein LBS44_03045 [Deltaproteobacteria bacterium]|nr:hypothetical protein [Deltaproteobacteria bacterium]